MKTATFQWDEENVEHGKYNIEIDADACIGCGNCVDEAPGTLEMEEEEMKAVVKDPNGDDDESQLESAKICPVEAIIITDKESGDQIWPE